ncbi:hypothetical protein SteCoe_4552 [Stentor coeruleus]|uniref:HNH nuclease domain-containing protein n=1 Tax=Stentor coeruleus TaxID=5963 RepID=A0A1R2CUM9_9CILI|nr:hypothetical protein SteCoe_4552 [Stentor coeruleus]
MLNNIFRGSIKRFATSLTRLPETTSYVIKVNEQIINPLWTGGKTRGNIQLVNHYYYVRYSKTLISFIKISDFHNIQKAFAHAKKVLYAYCKENNLLRNEYRICEDYDGRYLEVKAGNVVFMCDIDCLEIVEEYNWMHIARDNIIYTIERDDDKIENIYFHRLCMGMHKHENKVMHRDGNKLNNRKSNLVIEYKK